MNTLELFHSTPKLKQYIRDENRIPYGVIVAEPIIVGNAVVISIGMSICHDSDKFDKKLAYELAANRAVTCEWHRIKNLPPKFHLSYTIDYEHMVRSLYDECNKFVARCQAYYKNLHVLSPRIVFI